MEESTSLNTDEVTVERSATPQSPDFWVKDDPDSTDPWRYLGSVVRPNGSIRYV